MKRGDTSTDIKMFLSHTLYINVISSISSPYHDQLCHYMSSDIFFTILLYPPIEDIWPQYIVWSSFLSYPSGSGCFYMEGILIYPEGEEKELQGLSRKFQKVWLESGGVVGVEWLWQSGRSGVVGVGYNHQSIGSKRWLPVQREWKMVI